MVIHKILYLIYKQWLLLLILLLKGVEAICCYTSPKNVELFEKLNVLKSTETSARQSVMLTQYVGVVEIEVYNNNNNNNNNNN